MEKAVSVALTLLFYCSSPHSIGQGSNVGIMPVLSIFTPIILAETRVISTGWAVSLQDPL